MIERLGGPGTEPTEDEERKTKPCTETGLSARSEIASNGSHISWMDGRCEIGRAWYWEGRAKAERSTDIQVESGLMEPMAWVPPALYGPLAAFSLSFALFLYELDCWLEYLSDGDM
jgi:hypothetical protein